MARMEKIKFLSDVEIDGQLTVKGGSLNATPDWNQNDETAPGFIKNKTHGVITEPQYLSTSGCLVSTTNYQYSDKLVVQSEMECSEDWSDSIAENTELVFTITNPNLGLIVEVTTQKANGIIGNKCLFDETALDTGEEIYVAHRKGANGASVFFCLDSQVLDAIKTTDSPYVIINTNYHAVKMVQQLDEKFIPDTIARAGVIGSIESALDELHNYAQALIGGEAE